MLPTLKKVKNTIIHIMTELYYKNVDEQNSTQFLNNGIGIKKSNEKPRRLARVFGFLTIKRIEVQEKNGGVILRIIIRSKINGRFKVLSGMSIANRPWSIISSFKKVIGLAFATGSYMLLFNTVWKLSVIYDLTRFITLMLMAMLGMVIWIVFAHDLWEKKDTKYNSKQLRLLYNFTTILTLSISVITFYIAMFLLFLVAVAVFVPKDTFSNVIENEIGFIDYIRLAWLVSSAATVAGAIGAGLENEDAVKRCAYGYRQYTRLKELEEIGEGKGRQKRN